MCPPRSPPRSRQLPPLTIAQTGAKRGAGSVWLLLCVLGLGCGDTSGALPEGQPLDEIAGFSGLPTMQPGVDCLSCHAAGGRAAERPWTVAGTVFPSVDAGLSSGLEGAQVLLTDTAGRQLTLTTNAAGNFYTAEALADLADVQIQRGQRRVRMELPAVGGGSLLLLGSCNRCHQDQPKAGAPVLGIQGAPGRLFVPEN